MYSMKNLGRMFLMTLMILDPGKIKKEFFNHGISSTIDTDNLY